MDPVQDLKALQERKQKLLLECELNRQMLGLETEMIRLRVTQWKGGLQSLPEAWKFLAPLTGFLLGSRFKGKKARLAVAGAVGLVVFARCMDWEKWFSKRRDTPS